MFKNSALAAIDLGSNSIRLICARAGYHDSPSLDIFLRDLKVARLGEGFEPERYLIPSAMDRAISALKEMISGIRRHQIDQVHVVTTGVVREAKNQKLFLDRINETLGIQVRVLQGEEEAELTLLGVRSTLSGLSIPLLICDIGGGSTEFAILFPDDSKEFFSLPIGAIRLIEKFQVAAPMCRKKDQAIRAYIMGSLKKTFHSFCGHISTLVATAGTPTTLASIDQALRIYDPLKVHGYPFQSFQIKKMYEQLKGMNLHDRRSIPGLESGREDIIVTGTAILLCVMETFNQESMIVSEGGLLEGALAQTYQNITGHLPQIYL